MPHNKRAYMLTIVCFCALITGASFEMPVNEREFTGFFSKMMAIDTTDDSCGTTTPALLYAFESDSARSATGKMFLYGLIKCPTNFNQALFNYSNKVSVTYRECTKQDMQNVVIQNRQKFFNVRYYLVTGIGAAN